MYLVIIFTGTLKVIIKKNTVLHGYIISHLVTL